ncbi:MAG: hypothetical protein ACRCS8_00700 [Brevinema sp.]
MYNELEKYLTGYLPPNYWYDEGVDIAQDMISNFKDDDWKQLLERLSIQDIEWKKKLAYCLYDESNKYELIALLELIDTKDEELFEICLDSLRNFINKESVDFFINNSEIVSRIEKLLHNADKPTQVVIADLLNKISEFTENK